MESLKEEKLKDLLKQVVTHFDKEDRSARDRQIRKWKQLKYFWDGISRVWWNEVAHDWRVYEPSQYSSDDSQEYYDKSINVFRAYLESIIAALSVTVPPVRCYPDDADNSLDISTARAGDKIAELIYRHNNAPLLWLHGLYIFCTEGLVACYNYTHEDVKYGTYKKEDYEDEIETHQITTCPSCGNQVDDQIINQQEDKANPNDADVTLDSLIADNIDLCPQCMQIVDMQISQKEMIITKLVGVSNMPKARQCIEVYGGLNVKIPLWARKQCDIPYLFYCYEDDYANIAECYPDLYDYLLSSGKGKTGGAYNQFEEWGRLSTQYRGEYPINNRTVRKCWLRPCAFNILQEEDSKFLKKHFPDGAKVVFVNDQFAEAENQDLDAHWTLTYNPMTDYLIHDPLGTLLTSVQEITGDLVSLTLQTIEHGIGQTFVDQAVVDMEAYRNTEVLPGGLYAATPKSGKSMQDAFYQIKTSTLSQEVEPFFEKIQTLGQLCSGALPSLFGGAMNESNTASEYSMSRSQALQRLQNTWKMMTMWWKDIFGKVIPAYIECVQEDEKTVERDQFGGFVNTFVRMAELEGKIGKIELEANENLPLTWNQKRDIIMQLLQTGNPEILSLMGSPENLPVIKEAIGLDNFYVPGEDDRAKQYEEIQMLLKSQPQMIPPAIDPMMAQDPNFQMQMQQNPQMAQQMQPQEIASVQPEPEVDDNEIHLIICKAWAVSEAGRLAKIENPEGYKNVLLHAQMHQQIEAMMQIQAPMGGQGAPPQEQPKESTSAPIQQESDINVSQ